GRRPHRPRGLRRGRRARSPVVDRVRDHRCPGVAPRHGAAL
ncbi:MAG: hypothetical protein AVDCRST_MAG53-2019, partial [uncultured Solirubrobacteraceae bacterium]